MSYSLYLKVHEKDKEYSGIYGNLLPFSSLAFSCKLLFLMPYSLHLSMASVMFSSRHLIDN